MLLMVLWVLAVGLLNINITNPYVSETLFTFNKDDALETKSLATTAASASGMTHLA